MDNLHATNMDMKNDTPSSVTDIELNNIQEKNGGINGEINHDYLDEKSTGWLGSSLSKLNGSTASFFTKNMDVISVVMKFVFNGLVIGYLFASLYYWINHDPKPLELCNGFGSLIAFLSIVYFFVIYFLLVKPYLGVWFHKNVWNKVMAVYDSVWKHIWFRVVLSLAVLLAIAIFLYVDTKEAPERLISLVGLAIILVLGFAFSSSPGRISWRPVVMGLALQFLCGLLFIRWDAGRLALQCFSDKVSVFLSYGVDGAAFAFGDLLVRTEGVFAFASLPVVFFFSMLVEVLFYWGALQWFCLKLGGVLQAITGTTVCESVICIGNVFLGMTESVLLIKPYVAQLTPAEIHLVMASGFATVSGTILASYIAFGASAAHLVTASVMSAPAAICYSKLLMPETRRSLTTVENIQPITSEDQSVLAAASRGASNGISLLLNIIANIIAFVAFIAFLNGLLGYFGSMLGFSELNLEWIFGKILIPLCWTMGVPWSECEHVGALIGLKTVVNEFVAYQRMGEMKRDGLLSPRSELIATYALCGFTNPGSAGIMVGSIAALAPNQRETLASVAVRAFFAACGICFMTACIAGLLMPEGSFV